MKNILEAIEFAETYLWSSLRQAKRDGLIDRTEIDKQPGLRSLHRALQYRLCECCERLLKQFGEVTRKDVAFLIEAWVMAQGTSKPAKPMPSMEWQDWE